MHTGGEPVRLIVEGFPDPAAPPCSTSATTRRPARPPPPPPHAGAPRTRRDVRRTRGAGRPTRRVRRAVHAPLRLQHHVRSRDDRSRPLGGRHRPRAASRRPRRLHSGMPLRPGRGARHGWWRPRRVRQRARLSVPAFATEFDTSVDLPSTGRILCDIGYGGAFYAILPASRWASTCAPHRSDNCARRRWGSCRRSARAARSPPDRARPLVPLQRHSDRRHAARISAPDTQSLRVRRRSDRPQRHRQRRHRPHGGGCGTRPDRAGFPAALSPARRACRSTASCWPRNRSVSIAPGASASRAPRRSAAPLPGSSSRAIASGRRLRHRGRECRCHPCNGDCPCCRRNARCSISPSTSAT